MVEVIELFEAREHLRPGAFLRAWASEEGQDLYRQLELGRIGQSTWNGGFASLLGYLWVRNLMGRLLYFLDPAHDVLKLARQARNAGVRTAVLSNCLGHDPHDPYAGYNLPSLVDVVVFSDDHGVRKPDRAIFEITLDLLAVPAVSCVFADDTEANLVTAAAMGMTVVHALDEQETAGRLRSLLGLARRLPCRFEEVPHAWGARMTREFPRRPASVESDRAESTPRMQRTAWAACSTAASRSCRARCASAARAR